MSEDKPWLRILDKVDAEYLEAMWSFGMTLEELALLLQPEARQTKQEVMRLLGLRAKNQGVN